VELTKYSWFAYNTGYESRVTEEDLQVWRYIYLSTGRSPCDSGLFLADLLKQLYNRGLNLRPQGESVRERVCDLGRLATYIALDLRDPNQSTLQQAQKFMNTLNQWHRTLPLSMQLSRLNLEDPSADTGQARRALLQLHILFLGLFIEPFRSCLVDIGNVRLGEKISTPTDVETMEYVEKQSVLAARQSARVASILQINQLVRSHCWVAV
jgi:hypothetical protein